MESMRYQLISCEVLYREMCDAVARSPHQVDVVFLSKGLHDLGGKAMRKELQQHIDTVKAGRHDAILMGYALCGNGLAGLEAREVPLVVPRAHDCIALLMGSRVKHAEFFEANPGTYFRSTGWLERGKSGHQLAMGADLAGTNLDELIEAYGEDNGRYLYEEFTRYKATYQQLVYIESGLEPDGRFEEAAREEATEKGWAFQKVCGSLELFRKLIFGEWPEEEFLLVPPGHAIAASYDDLVMRAERVSP